MELRLQENKNFNPYRASESVFGRLYHANKFIIILLLILSLFGTLMMVSVGGDQDLATKHLLKVILGFFIMALIICQPIERIYNLSFYLYIAGVLLLVLVDVMGIIGLGARRWLNIGGLRFQPSEIMKIALILALARWYHQTPMTEIRRFRGLFIPLGLIFLPVLLVMAQPDLGTAMLMLMTGAVILFLVGVPLRFFAMGIGLVVSAAVPLWTFILHDYQKNRILTFLSPEQDPTGTGYHILQSLITIGAGGFFGKGFGKGTQSYNEFLPEKHTDFIFAVVSEEFGFFGAILVLLTQLALIIYSFIMINQIKSSFGRLVSGGVIGYYALHVMINSAMVMGLLPVVGVPLPLISYGGSVMISVLIGFGLFIGANLDKYVVIDSKLQYKTMD